MTKRGTPSKNRRIPTFSLDRSSFAIISAVEGLVLSPEMQRDFASFDEKGLSAAERRQAIVRKYGTRSA